MSAESATAAVVSPAKTGRRRPFMFKVYGLGCATLAMLVVVAAGIMLVMSLRTETRVTVTPSALPPDVAPLLPRDPLPPAVGDPAANVDIAGIPFHNANRRIRIEVASGPVPPTLARIVRTRYESFVDAASAGGAPVRPMILPSVDLIGEWVRVREEAIVVGIESAFIDGNRDADIMPAWRLLTELTAMVNDVADRFPSGVREARAWIAVAMRQLDRDLPGADADLVDHLQKEFDASPLFHRPVGLWRSAPIRQRAWRTIRWLMTAVPSPGSPVIAAALKAQPANSPWLAHYRRWLRVLDGLHGPSTHATAHLTFAAWLDGSTSSDDNLSLLPWRFHLPADQLVEAAQLAVALAGQRSASEGNARADADPLAEDELWAVFARTAVVGGRPRLSADSGYVGCCIRARGWSVVEDDRVDSGSGGVGFGPHVKWLRIAGHVPTVTTEHSTRLDVWRGCGCSTEVAVPAGTQLLMEPVATTYAPISSVHLLRRTIPPEVVPAQQWQEIHAAALPGSVIEWSVRELANETMWHGASLHVIGAAQSGYRPHSFCEQVSSPSTLDYALKWLQDDFRTDPSLSHDVREAWPVANLPDGRIVWIGVRGVVLLPVTITIVDGGEETGRAQQALLPLLDRRLYVSDGAPPSTERWRLLCSFSTDDALPSLAR